LEIGYDHWKMEVDPGLGLDGLSGFHRRVHHINAIDIPCLAPLHAMRKQPTQTLYGKAFF
jgi:hypothetical protein